MTGDFLPYNPTMTRSERSAGVVPFHRDSAGTLTYLLLDYGHHWDFPKGHVEKGETDQTAAIRELHEETGLTPKSLRDDFAHEIQYFFRAKDKALVRKSVVFFLAEVADTKVKLSHEHVGHAFLPYELALKKLTFDNARELLRAANQRLNE